MRDFALGFIIFLLFSGFSFTGRELEKISVETSLQLQAVADGCLNKEGE